MGAVPMSASELASAIERMSGIDAAAYAEERLRALQMGGDQASVDRFKAVADIRSGLRQARETTIEAVPVRSN